MHRGLIAVLIPVLLSISLISRSAPPEAPNPAAERSPWMQRQPQAPIFPGEEKYFRVIYELTNHGENAEGYFSFDDRWLVYQATVEPYRCDQIFVLDLWTGRRHRVSTGTGRTTCGFFFPDGETLLFSSTHQKSEQCPPPPDYRRGYVWALYDYDIYLVNRDGTRLRPLFRAPGYQAEATVGSNGRIVFTSDHEGDLDIYTMNADGSDLRRLTRTPGYDGGPFFSPDNQWVVFRASRPKGPDLETYFSLLREHLVRPFHLEIYVMRADGSDMRPLTANGAANFAPYFWPNGRGVIFASNVHAPRSRDFDLYTVDLATRTLTRITYYAGFDSFPMFSHDCRYLVFASNRTERHPGQTNLYIAELTETARSAWCAAN